MLASLPMVSRITFVWIHHDLRDQLAEAVHRLAAHSTGVFWFVLPSLPMFLLFPAMLKRGMGFWLSLVVGCVLTSALYLLVSRILARQAG